MAIDTTPSTVATNALQSIPFSAMIGGPLDAAIKAQALAAQTSWEFIKNVGLYTDQSTGETKAVSVSFQYQKDGEMVNLIVPLLAIVPIPYIAIDTITIDFMAKIDASASTYAEQASESEGSFKGSADVSVGWGPFSAKVHMEGGYSSKSSSKATQESKYSVEYTLNIHVQAGQDSMPAGLATVLNILNSAITSANPKGVFDVSPSTGSAQAGGASASFGIKSRNSQDLADTTPVSIALGNIAWSSGSAPPSGSPLTAADLVLSASVGTLSGTASPYSLTPSDKGIGALDVAIKSGTVVAAAQTVDLTLTQGSKTATVTVNLLPATA
ncbi:MAG: DUF2589 domain-containing protein [Myxococcales bacterium]|nr:DUF2589 domain-containing protein [Myxococcales bacterium]